MKLMEEEHKYPDKSPIVEVAGPSISEGVVTMAERLIVEFRRELAFEFEMKDLGLMHYFLGLEVWQRSDEIFLS